MNSYFRCHTLRNRQKNQPSPPREFVTRTRYNYKESIREIRKPRRIQSARRPRDRDYCEQQDDIDRTENIRQESPEPESNLVPLSDSSDTARPGPSSNEETAKTATDDQNEDEN